MDRYNQGPIQRAEGRVVLPLYVDGAQAEPQGPWPHRHL